MSQPPNRVGFTTPSSSSSHDGSAGGSAEAGETPARRADQNLKMGPKQVRKQHPKTRTGCFTCRTRRVKCDETKPGCNRCLKSGWECDGYLPDDSQLKASRPTPKLLPRDPLQTQLGVMRIRTGPIFKDQRQGHYFRYYCEIIAAQIGGPSSTTLWDTIVPQSGELEPSIAYCIVALGALSLSRTNAWHHQIPQEKWRKALPEDSHYQYALIQYGKALKGMSQAIQNIDRDIRTALISCLLVFCFECLLGRQAAASTHASSGVNLLHNYHKRKAKCNEVPEIPVRDDLSAAYMGLDLHSLTLINTQTLETHQALKMNTTTTIRHMPSTFESLKQCRTFWQLIMLRNFHFIATGRAAIGRYMLELQNANTADDESLQLSEANHVCCRAYIPPSCIPLELLAEQDEYMSDIRRWELASMKIFSQIPLGTDDYIARSLLKINVALTKITCGLTFHQTHPPELGYDSYLPEFTTIITLAASIQPFLITSPSQNTPFHFDVGILPGLTATASHCRNREVRAEAIRLMLNAPGYREGIWDSLSIGTICDWKRKLEEDYMDENGQIPGYRRGTVSTMNLNLQERTAKVALKQWNGPEMSDSVTRETVLRW